MAVGESDTESKQTRQTHRRLDKEQTPSYYCLLVVSGGRKTGRVCDSGSENFGPGGIKASCFSTFFSLTNKLTNRHAGKIPIKLMPCVIREKNEPEHFGMRSTHVTLRCVHLATPWQHSIKKQRRFQHFSLSLYPETSLYFFRDLLDSVKKIQICQCEDNKRAMGSNALVTEGKLRPLP